MSNGCIIGSIPVQARKLAHAVRSHWEVENRLHWFLDVCLNDDQARARVKNSMHVGAEYVACAGNKQHVKTAFHSLSPSYDKYLFLWYILRLNWLL